MRSSKNLRWIVIVLVIGLLTFAAGAQEDMTPSITVSDQLVTAGNVVVDSVVTNVDGFVVIHADADGSPGPVLGQTAVTAGEHTNVAVAIDSAGATSVLYAMLHEDTGEAGVYEFGTVEGADLPVRVDDSVVVVGFLSAGINAFSQIVDEGTYTANSVTIGEPGWLVVHADNEGRPGTVLGFAPLEAGVNNNVMVELDQDGVTNVVWLMLHSDTGEAGVYEFGTVEGADSPISLNGRVAMIPVWTVPYMDVDHQLLIFGDSMEMMDESPVLMANAVLSDGPGWLVVHAAGEGGPGPVIGFAPVTDGLNRGVEVELDPEGLTTTVFPMLHVDTGEVGTYEFGTVEGADGPVVVDEVVVTYPVDVAPSISYNDVTFVDGEGMLVVGRALIDADGWLVIHEDNNGSPGAVLGFAPISSGMNTNIEIDLGLDEAPPSVFPMLHYDTDGIGEYEFGSVDGADLPVVVREGVVTGPATVEVVFPES